MKEFATSCSFSENSLETVARQCFTMVTLAVYSVEGTIVRNRLMRLSLPQWRENRGKRLSGATNRSPRSLLK
jgi:hypothetical protein